MSKNATKRGNQHHNTTRKWSTRPPSKISDAPNAVGSDRITVEGNTDFSRLSKPSLPNDGKGKDVTDHVQNKRPLQRVDRIFHTVTTNDGPVIRPVPKTHGNVYTTGAILATSMCGARSNYSWDIFIEKIGNHLSMTKHDNTELTVNETSILRYMLDSCMKQKDGKYIIKKDPNKPMIRLYDILDNSSESNGEAKEVYDDAAFHANGPPAATSEAVTVAANAAAAAAATGATISAGMERGTAVAATIPSIDRESAGRGGVQAEVMRTLSKQSTKKRDQHRGTTLGVRPPPKVRNALAAVNPDRVTVGVRDFSRLSKPSLPNVDKSNDITTYATGTKMYDRVNVQNEMAPQQQVDKFFLTASTVDERITIVPKIYVKVHTTGAVLVTLMCCANFSCDIFIKKIGDKLFMGKDDHTKLSVNGIGIMRCIIDNCVKQKDGIYLVKKESGKPMIRLYNIPDSTLESNGKEIKGNDGEEFRTNRPLAVTVAANVATTAATAGATTSAAMKPATAGAIPSPDRERAGRGGVQAGAMRTLSKQSTKKRDQRPGTTLGVRPPPKIRDALTAVNPERVTVGEKDFPRLSKPSLPNVEKGNAITTSANDTKAYDRVSVENEMAPQQRVDKFFLIPSTVDERITLVPKIYGNVQAKGAVLATLMCCTNFSCDIVIKKVADTLFMGKDDHTKLSVNGIGILRCIIDNCVKQKDGIYLVKKESGKPMIRLYNIPDSTLESNAKEIKGNDGEAFRTIGPLAVTVAANAATTAATAGATTSAAMKPATAGAIPSTDLQRAGCGGGPLRTLSKNSTKERDQHRGTILERGVRPQPKIRDALAAANPDRVTVEEGDFPCLSKLSLLSTAPVATGKTSAATESATSAAASKFRPPSILKERSAEEIRQYMASQAKKWLKGGRVATAANSSGSSQQDRCGGSVYRLSHGEGDIQEYYVASIVEPPPDQ